MNKYLTIAGSLALMFAVNANAAFVVDTGTPDNKGFPYLLNHNQSLIGQVTFNQSLTLNSIEAYILTDGSDSGATFAISLYSDNANTVGDLIKSKSATYLADGWNGASALNWSVDAGTYWIGIEEPDFENFTATQKVANPLAKTGFSDAGNYTYSLIAFGLRVDAVPETDTYAMLLAGLGFMGLVARRRNA